MEEEEKEPALRQEFHIPSFTHEDPGKDPVPQSKNKGAGVEAPRWRDPKEIGESSEQGPRWQETSIAKE